MAKIDDIQNWMQIRIEAVEEKYDKLRKKGTVWLVALVATVVAAIILIITVFKPKNNTDADAKIEVLQNHIKDLQRNNASIDSQLQVHNARLMENRKTETIIKHHYEKIPGAVRDLTKDQLRREVTEFE